MNAPIVCCVGTTDPWNAAGLGLDVRVLETFGVRALSVVAAVSAQDVRGLHAAQALAIETIAAQCAALAAADIAAYRIGALPSVAVARTIASVLRDVRVPVVYDPALGPSGGGRFAEVGAARAICEALLPLVTLVTPNLGEARVLVGDPQAKPVEAATALRALGARAVLVTGIAAGERIEDLFFDDAGARTFAATRLSEDARGTGCMLASAIAASLARGVPLVPAIESGRAFVRARIADAESIGGMRVMHLRP